MPPSCLPQAQVQLRQLLLNCPPEALPQRFYRRIFSPLVTLYYLTRQALDPDMALQDVVTDVHGGGADCFGQGALPSRKIRSLATTAYSKARKRLSLTTLRHVLAQQVKRGCAQPSKAGYRGKAVRLLDGSTIALRPFGDVPAAFPPHSATAGQGYWSLMRVVVSFCLETGLAVDTAMGSKHESEQRLARQLLAGGPQAVLYLADRNFGIFSVVQAIGLAGADLLVRLTEVRARKLLGRPPRAGTDVPLSWACSPQDQQAQAGVVAGRLICLRVARKGFRSQRLCLFTTLSDPRLYPTAELAALYGVRWQVELNLRYVKAEMKLGRFQCHSAQMAQKQWLAGLIAYNLIRSVMSASSRQYQLPPESLSFSVARQLLVQWLTRHAGAPQTRAQGWNKLFAILAGVRRCKRTRPRPSEPRKLRYLARGFPPLKGSRAQARRALKQICKS